MKKAIIIAMSLAAVSVQATQYSKLSIITAAKELDRWESLKGWIAAAGIQDEFQNCSYLSDTYPQYPSITNMLVQSGVLSIYEIRYILDKSVDTSVPDEMIRRVVDSECLTASGRIKWHGPIVETMVDTNAMTKTNIHQDGFSHVISFASLSAMRIEDRLTNERIRLEHKEELAMAAARREQKRRDRIAELTTNLTAAAASLADAKQYPMELAMLLLQVELSTLVGTNVVHAVTMPGKE